MHELGLDDLNVLGIFGLNPLMLLLWQSKYLFIYFTEKNVLFNFDNVFYLIFCIFLRGTFYIKLIKKYLYHI